MNNNKHLGVLYKAKLNDLSPHDRKPPKPETEKELLLNTLSYLVRENRRYYFQTRLGLTDFSEAKLGKVKAANSKQAMGSIGFSMQNAVWFLQ